MGHGNTNSRARTRKWKKRNSTNKKGRQSRRPSNRSYCYDNLFSLSGGKTFSFLSTEIHLFAPTPFSFSPPFIVQFRLARGMRFSAFLLAVLRRSRLRPPMNFLTFVTTFFSQGRTLANPQNSSQNDSTYLHRSGVPRVKKHLEKLLTVSYLWVVVLGNLRCFESSRWYSCRTFCIQFLRSCETEKNNNKTNAYTEWCVGETKFLYYLLENFDSPV